MTAKSRADPVKAGIFTPSLSVEGLIIQAQKHLEKGIKVGEEKEGKPYWQPVMGIIRWELRQHYYDSQGKRRTRLLEIRKRKPIKKKGG